MAETTALVRADSVGPHGVRITTLELSMPRFILAQFLTHRAFSRNAASSRAVPVARLRQKVEDDPYVPRLSVAGKGMASNDIVSVEEQEEWERDVLILLGFASALSEKWEKRGHKQHVNRYLEPFSYVSVLVTATDWDNFFSLRLGHDAQPEMQELAKKMKEALEGSEPAKLRYGAWHVPFGEKTHGLTLRHRLEVATARCARISYETHDGVFSLEKDTALHYQLLSDRHLSPFEHCAQCDTEERRNANFLGWVQYRTFVERNWVIS
jgi:thymidylate synthase ThyX